MVEGHAPGERSYRRLLVALFFAGIAMFAQLYSFQAVLPQVSRTFHVDAAAAALTVSAATLGLAIGVIPWSIVADRVGRVPAMAVGIAVATVVGIAVPFLPDFAALLGARLVEGAMAGAVPAIAMAYVSEEVAPAHTARAAGVYIAGTSVGGLVGRIVAAPIADLVGWPVGVLSVALLCAASAVLFVVLVPPARAPRPERGGVARRLVDDLRSPRQLALYAQGLLLMGGFVAVYNYLGFRLAEPPFSVPPILLGLLFLAYLAGTVASARAGALAARRGRLPVLVGATVLLAVGVLLTLVPSLPVIVVGLLVLTAGFFAAHSTAAGWAPVIAPGGRAQASSLYNLAYYAGSSIVGWGVGLAFVGAGWPGVVLAVAALAVAAVSIALVVLLRRTGRGDAIQP
ncbi:MFS transporter [Pseudolysinimonas sp.]|uniref:MFS transporter n=1 Tax=Pseudolysinimonas sp. TaxID=2680009 RepID=UPI003F7DEC16